MTDSTIRFIHRGQTVTLANVPPTRTLLEVLREDLAFTGTKEGCGEGDCGACTVVLGEANQGRIEYRAINSCIRLAHSVDGLALWTAEDLAVDPLIEAACEDGKPARADGGPGARSAGTGMDIEVHEDSGHRATMPPVRSAGLHPAQQAMLDCHGSQCGFCTPGFVMSLFGLYQNEVCHGRPVTRDSAQAVLSGNLCRCTGYRPILDAAQAMEQLPPRRVNEADLLSKLEQISTVSRWPDAKNAENPAYAMPTTLPALLALRAANPKAQIVAGCTDVGLWVTKQHREFEQVLDVTRVAELRQIVRAEGTVSIGAAVTLADAFAALVADRPQLLSFASRFAGLPVRNSGTLGGNVANGSPIGDSMPLLIAMNATVVLASVRGERELPLEQLYTGYRQNVMTADEVLAWIRVPLAGGDPHPNPLPQAGEGVNSQPGTVPGITPSSSGGEGVNSQPGTAPGITLSPPGGEGVNSQPGTAPGITPSPLRGEGWGEGRAPARPRPEHPPPHQTPAPAHWPGAACHRPRPLPRPARARPSASPRPVRRCAGRPSWPRCR